MEIPKTAEIRLNDAERFMIGFKQLCQETNLYSVDYCNRGLQCINFQDGTSIGVRVLMNNIGINW